MACNFTCSLQWSDMLPRYIKLQTAEREGNEVHTKTCGKIQWYTEHLSGLQTRKIYKKNKAYSIDFQEPKGYSIDTKVHKSIFNSYKSTQKYNIIQKIHKYTKAHSKDTQIHEKHYIIKKIHKYTHA